MSLQRELSPCNNYNNSVIDVGRLLVEKSGLTGLAVKGNINVEQDLEDLGVSVRLAVSLSTNMPNVWRCVGASRIAKANVRRILFYRVLLFEKAKKSNPLSYTNFRMNSLYGSISFAAQRKQVSVEYSFNGHSRSSQCSPHRIRQPGPCFTEMITRMVACILE